MRCFLATIGFVCGLTCSLFLEIKTEATPAIIPPEAGPEYEIIYDEYDCYQYDCYPQET